jgi:peptide deformylase
MRALVADMFDTMYAAEGIGLAAPQVGRSERVFVMDVDDNPLAMINPEIIEREGSERAEEGCLSIPEIFGDVDRATRIVARAIGVDGKPFEVELTDLAARCVQHELDHLDGKLFIDYMSLIKRKFTARKWEKEAANYPGFIRKLEPGKPRSRRSRSRNAKASGTTPPPDQEL